MLPLFQRTLDLRPGTAITRDTRAALSRLLPPDVMQTVNREANRPTPAVIRRIYSVLAETRSPLRPFTEISNPGAQLLSTGRRFDTYVRDPDTPEGRNLLFFIRHIVAGSPPLVNVGNVEEVLYVPSTQERAMFREMPRFKNLLRQILNNRDYQNLGTIGVISATHPYTVTGQFGKLGRLNEQIAQKQDQIHVLRGVPATADTATRMDRLTTEIASLEGRIGDVETKKQELRDRLDEVNQSTQIMLALPTLPWPDAMLNVFANNMSVLDTQIGTMDVSYAHHTHPLRDTLDDNSMISRRAKWALRKPASGTLQTSALALRQLVEEFGVENVRYSNEAELKQFTEEMYARLTSDQPTLAAPSTEAAPGATGAPGTPATHAGPGTTNPIVAPAMPGSGGVVRPPASAARLASSSSSTSSSSGSSPKAASSSTGFSINPVNWVKGAWRNKGSMAAGAVVGGILIPVVGAPLGAAIAPWVKKYFVDSKEPKKPSES